MDVPEGYSTCGGHERGFKAKAERGLKRHREKHTAREPPAQRVVTTQPRGTGSHGHCQGHRGWLCPVPSLPARPLCAGARARAAPGALPEGSQPARQREFNYRFTARAKERPRGTAHYRTSLPEGDWPHPTSPSLRWPW